MKPEYYFAALLILLLFMRVEAIDAQNVIAGQEVELKGSGVSVCCWLLFQPAGASPSS
jgi:hypothetical protein